MKEKFDWYEEKGDIYFRCKNCSTVFVWRPYKPKNWHGKSPKGVGKFDIPDAESYYPFCKNCRDFADLWARVQGWYI